MEHYSTLKLIHVTTVTLSLLLFVWRFSLLVRFPEQPLARPLKIIPHVNDTVLLVAAVGMLMAMSLNPLKLPWLLAKLVVLPVYIVLGAKCLRSDPGSRRQLLFFGLAVAAFGYMLALALRKQVLPF